MSGKGGHKHRGRKKTQKWQRDKKKARADVARVRGIFEAKGQAWDPKNNAAQLAALNHAARRLVMRSEVAER